MYIGYIKYQLSLHFYQNIRTAKIASHLLGFSHVFLTMTSPLCVICLPLLTSSCIIPSVGFFFILKLGKGIVSHCEESDLDPVRCSGL